MPVNLSIKNAPDDLVALLKQRAQRNHRSLQGETLAILEEAVRGPGRLTPLQLLAKVEKLDLENTQRVRRDHSQNARSALWRLRSPMAPRSRRSSSRNQGGWKLHSGSKALASSRRFFSNSKSPVRA